MEAYQQRVVEERDELEARMKKLGKFIRPEVGGPDPVSVNELDRLQRQEMVMKLYFHVLTERIDAFTQEV